MKYWNPIGITATQFHSESIQTKQEEKKKIAKLTHTKSKFELIFKDINDFST